MTSVFKLPLLGETMETGRVALWLKRPGDSFRRGETILEVETDKTVVEVPALNDGTLVEILADQGAQLKVGEPLCVIRSDASSDVAAIIATPAPSAPASVTQEAPPLAAIFPTGEAARRRKDPITSAAFARRPVRDGLRTSGKSTSPKSSAPDDVGASKLATSLIMATRRRAPR